MKTWIVVLSLLMVVACGNRGQDSRSSRSEILHLICSGRAGEVSSGIDRSIGRDRSRVLIDFQLEVKLNADTNEVVTWNETPVQTHKFMSPLVTRNLSREKLNELGLRQLEACTVPSAQIEMMAIVTSSSIDLIRVCAYGRDVDAGEKGTIGGHLWKIDRIEGTFSGSIGIPHQQDGNLGVLPFVRAEGKCTSPSERKF